MPTYFLFISLFVYWDKILLCFNLIWAQDGLRLALGLLPQSPQCLDWSHVPPCHFWDKALCGTGWPQLTGFVQGCFELHTCYSRWAAVVLKREGRQHKIWKHESNKLATKGRLDFISKQVTEAMFSTSVSIISTTGCRSMRRRRNMVRILGEHWPCGTNFST